MGFFRVTFKKHSHLFEVLECLVQVLGDKGLARLDFNPTTGMTIVSPSPKQISIIRIVMGVECFSSYDVTGGEMVTRHIESVDDEHEIIETTELEPADDISIWICPKKLKGFISSLENLEDVTMYHNLKKNPDVMNLSGYSSSQSAIQKMVELEFKLSETPTGMDGMEFKGKTIKIDGKLTAPRDEAIKLIKDLMNLELDTFDITLDKVVTQKEKGGGGVSSSLFEISSGQRILNESKNCSMNVSFSSSENNDGDDNVNGGKCRVFLSKTWEKRKKPYSFPVSCLRESLKAVEASESTVFVVEKPCEALDGDSYMTMVNTSKNSGAQIFHIIAPVFT